MNKPDIFAHLYPVIDGVQMRRCTSCQQAKPLETFGALKTGKFGRTTECMACHQSRNRAYRAANKEQISARRQGYRPPYPNAKTIPPCLHAVRVQVTLQVEAGDWQEGHTRQLERLLYRMHYDDALICGEWRLELLYLERGLPQFRLYWNNSVFGVAHIATKSVDLGRSCRAPLVRRKLAAYLTGLGWKTDSVQWQRGISITDLSAPVQHQYRLFKTVLDTPHVDFSASLATDEVAV